MKEFATLMPAHLGLKQNLWLVPLQAEKQDVLITPPYYYAIKQFQNISKVFTAYEKLCVLKRTVSVIHSSVVDYHKKRERAEELPNFTSFAMYVIVYLF